MFIDTGVAGFDVTDGVVEDDAAFGVDGIKFERRLSPSTIPKLDFPSFDTSDDAMDATNFIILSVGKFVPTSDLPSDDVTDDTNFIRLSTGKSVPTIPDKRSATLNEVFPVPVAVAGAGDFSEGVGTCTGTDTGTENPNGHVPFEELENPSGHFPSEGVESEGVETVEAFDESSDEHGPELIVPEPKLKLRLRLSVVILNFEKRKLDKSETYF